MGTYHINTNVNEMVQCAAWIAVPGIPAGPTSEVFLLENEIMERTLYQGLGDLASSSSFIYDLLKALSWWLTPLSLIFLTCKMGTIIPIPLELSYPV